MTDLIPLPARAAKPRTSGLTHVLDSGLGPLEVQSLLDVGAPHIDLVRLGWGSALVTGCLERKLELYRDAGVPVMLGGTLTELAWAHGRVDELADWVEELGIDRIEVSSGTIAIPSDEKAR
ncbi:MAG: phosphosulfolactate synthase, partial [bacterium]